jgi:RimJ/RimL family protein N-acetyltransferase
MKVIEKDKRPGLSKLFEGYEWNYLPDAILEGYLGRALADDEDDPQVAVLEASNLKLCIVGGDAGHPSAREYVEQLPTPAALIFASDGWEELVQEVHAGRLIDMPRYAFTSEKLDIEHLRRLGSQIPQGYRIESMDLDLAQQLAGERSEFASDHMLNFDSPEDFIERGFGFCILDGDEIVSVATTFAICDKGIEIQINTREEHQGKRLATVVAAHLLVYSLERNLDPNWDAANESSVGLAKKLGYTPQGTYSIVLVVGSRALAVLVRFGLKVKAFFERS